MSLSQTAVIVGAGPGIGAAAARQFVALGYQVALVARTESKLDELVAEFAEAGATAKAFPADAADPDSIDEAIRQIRAWAGGDPSVLLFNAFAFEPAGLTDELDPADFVRSLAANAGAAQHLVYHLAPALRAAGEGSLLFTGGGAALTPMGGGYAALSAGKAAMRSVVLTLAQDLEGTGVKVGTVTVCGMVAPGTEFDPDVIAAEFAKLHDGTEAGPEIVFTGAAVTA